MAMALSTTMAPSQRPRRRATPPTASVPSRRPHAPTSSDLEMAAPPHPRVRFDAAPRPSDRSFADLSAWRRPPLASVPTRVRSSFFPDSTDDDESGGHSAMMRLGETAFVPPPERTTLSPTFPVIHIGDVQFPTTRTVLWDRRVLAGPFELCTHNVLPRVRLTSRVLKQLYALVMDRTTRHVVGYAAPDDAAPLDESGAVVLSVLTPQKPESGARPPWWTVQFERARVGGSDEDDESDRKQIHDKARHRYESTSGTTSKRRILGLQVEARGFVGMSAERSHAEMDVSIDVVVPVVQLQFQLIRSLPLLMTPLAASLLRCEFGADFQRFGFLTLDRARKAVPLLETDPLVLQRPIVGLWVHGVDVDDSSAADAIRIHHPYLLESCVRFLLSKIIKERAQVDTDTFLVAVYPGNAAGPLPRFFECCAVHAPQSPSPVGWRSFSSRGRCLAGVSSFQSDLLLSFVVDTKENTTPAGSAVRLSQTRDQLTQVSFQPSFASTRFSERDNVEREAERGHKEILPTNNDVALGKLPQRDLVESDSMKSCCRSQQLLAVQHQQMLENQQRQLQDLQAQIAQLQKVLTETRAENARLVAASSLHSSRSSLVENGDQRDEEVEMDHHNESPIGSLPAPQQQEDDENHVQPEDNEKDTSMVSSLALSSISGGSNPSELSSVSSSLVGTHLKNLVTGEVEESGHSEDVAADAVKKHAEGTRDADVVSSGGNQDSHPLHADEIGSRIGDESASSDSDDGDTVRRACPYVPSARKLDRRVQCERDEFEDESDASKIDELLAERLRIPNTPNREEIVRGGALATVGFSHGSSFSIPKIKYVPEIVTCDSDDDEEEEIRRIELKYRKRRVH